MDGDSAPIFAENTLGALLVAGGAWTCGLTASHGKVRVTVLRGYWDITPAEFGFVLKLEGLGGASESAEWRVRQNEHEGLAMIIGNRQQSPDRQTAFESALQSVAQRVSQVGIGGMSDFTVARLLLDAALKRPERGSLTEWLSVQFAHSFEGCEWTIRHKLSNTAVRFRIVAAYAPEPDLLDFGRAALRLRYDSPDAANDATDGDGENEGLIQLGFASAWSLDHGFRDPSDEEDALPQIGRFKAWLAAELQHHVDTHGAALGIHYLATFQAYLPLVTLLEARLRFGSPGEPPVPPLSASGCIPDRAPSLARVSLEDARAATLEAAPFALLEIGGYLIACGDDVTEQPFGCPWIALLPPSERVWCEVLRVDAWNSPMRAVVDGDAFAFRRFVDWLRSAILACGFDVELTFARSTMLLTEWLRFGVSRIDDTYLIDWRHQWDIVSAQGTIVEMFAGLYGMSPQKVEALTTRDPAFWRRFLCDVVDSRFAYRT